jgi:hypothetical protein
MRPMSETGCGDKLRFTGTDNGGAGDGESPHEIL